MDLKRWISDKARLDSRAGSLARLALDSRVGSLARLALDSRAGSLARSGLDNGQGTNGNFLTFALPFILSQEIGKTVENATRLSINNL